MVQRIFLSFLLMGSFVMQPAAQQPNKEKEKKENEAKKAVKKSEKNKEEEDKNDKGKPKILYGTASYYANHFNGKPTANGEIFSQDKMTAACNVLPLGTWIRVTNLRNGRSVLLKVNDRLHPRMKRVVDLSRSAAQKLNFIRAGLTRVRVEVLGKKKPEN